ncbi:hypothetical protein XH99_00260 [Bradyrhizobium nanningense]|uniref:Uncharacterized protein n=1 Tax=Bradyrhizobium nanningense TaxID=1325118 RepID=A0A4Q0SK88_9BRAD|nr:hypothetical protein [Bradyrhizobium nanningense]RXH38729.1 hypothetical protein XH99_00260 [Bradyrhizobium nanningense]
MKLSESRYFFVSINVSLLLSRLSDDDVVQLVQKLAGYENAQIRKLIERKEKLARTAARQAATAELDKAVQKEKDAYGLYNDIAWGKPLPQVDPEGPARQQPPMHTRMRMGIIDYMPKIGWERRKAEEEHKRIDDRNRKVAGMSEEQRLAERPDVTEALMRTRARTIELRRTYEGLPDGTDPVMVKASEAPFEANDVRFSDAEIEILSGFMPSYFRTMRRRPSPRSIKSLLFKLQLARLLMQLRFPDHPTELQFDKLLQAFQQETLGASTDNEPPSLIVRQVI